MKQRSSLFYLLIGLIVIIGGAFLYTASVDLYPDELMEVVSSKTETDLKKIFDPPINALQKIREDGLNGSLVFTSEVELNNKFAKYIKDFSVENTLYFANNIGNQFIFYKDEDTWVSSFRNERIEKKKVLWKRWKSFDNPINEWGETTEYDPREEKWYQQVNLAYAKDSIFWTEPITSFATKQLSIDGAIFWKGANDSLLYGCAFEVPVGKISSALSINDNFDLKRGFIVNWNNHLLELSSDKIDSSLITDDLQNINAIAEKDSILGKLLSNWKMLGMKEGSMFKFNNNGDIWWASIKRFPYEKSNLLYGVAVEESDLIFKLVWQRLLLWALLGIIVIVAIVLFLIFRKKRSGSVTDYVSKDYSIKIEEMIKQGESSAVEFKSSLRWDLREEKVNKKLEEVIIKSVSAFNNGEGGSLIIGVADDGKILGLGNDIATLKKQNIDYFELHLRNLLNQTFGVNYTTRNVEILFPEIEGKNICVVNIKKGEKPLFITVHDKQGKKIEKFFVRSGNSSQEIASLSEMNEYIKNRFE